MTPEEYAAAQAAASAGLSQFIARFASLFKVPKLSPRDWLQLLALLFPEVQKRYAQSAALGRAFYDSQRRQHHPELQRNERLISEVQWEWFVQNMEPARKGMSQADSPNIAVTRLGLTAVREVEMAARRQIIGAVKNDPEPIEVQGWARIATGRETCAWCLMLISRGAEFPGKDTQWYKSALSAGVRLDDETVTDLYQEAGGDLAKFRDQISDQIEQWHVNCDCLVVPVFDVKNWPGRAAAQRAQQLWIDASKVAEDLINSGESRTKNKNNETLNALRRRIDHGEITVPSALAA